VPLVEQELLTLLGILSSPPFFSGVRVTRSLVLCVCFVDCCLSFCTLIFWPLCCLFFFDIRILITSLVSSNSSLRMLVCVHNTNITLMSLRFSTQNYPLVVYLPSNRITVTKLLLLFTANIQHSQHDLSECVDMRNNYHVGLYPGKLISDSRTGAGFKFSE